MRPLETLQSVMYEVYVSPAGDAFAMELLPPLTSSAIVDLSGKFPLNHLAADIQELLAFASGFTLPEFGEIRFDRFATGLQADYFPNGIEIMNDGLGNSWIADVGDAGKWGGVYFFCHEPGIILLQTSDLSEFIRQLDDFCRNGPRSTLHHSYEVASWEIWNDTAPFHSKNIVAGSDEVLRAFRNKYPSHHIIDMRNAKPDQGFAWNRATLNGKDVVRHRQHPLWAIHNRA